jgi:hypothetical protein
LLVILTAAKSEGLAFDEIWELALYGPRKDPRRIKFPHDTIERRQWRKALESGKETWQRAYLDQPDSGGEMVSFLFNFLSTRDDGLAMRKPEAAEVRREAIAI